MRSMIFPCLAIGAFLFFSHAATFVFSAQMTQIVESLGLAPFEGSRLLAARVYHPLYLAMTVACVLFGYMRPRIAVPLLGVVSALGLLVSAYAAQPSTLTTGMSVARAAALAGGTLAILNLYSRWPAHLRLVLVACFLAISSLVAGLLFLDVSLTAGLESLLTIAAALVPAGDDAWRGAIAAIAPLVAVTGFVAAASMTPDDRSGDATTTDRFALQIRDLVRGLVLQNGALLWLLGATLLLMFTSYGVSFWSFSVLVRLYGTEVEDAATFLATTLAILPVVAVAAAWLARGDHGAPDTLLRRWAQPFAWLQMTSPILLPFMPSAAFAMACIAASVVGSTVFYQFSLAASWQTLTRHARPLYFVVAVLAMNIPAVLFGGLLPGYASDLLGGGTAIAWGVALSTAVIGLLAILCLLLAARRLRTPNIPDVFS